MTAPTPAVERAAQRTFDLIAEGARDSGRWADLAPNDITRGWHLFAAQHHIQNALTDPDDPDSLARTLYVLYVVDAGIYSTAEIAVQAWTLSAPSRRKRWRAVADGLRMMLTGSEA
jgi:hypothetical protein